MKYHVTLTIDSGSKMRDDVMGLLEVRMPYLVELLTLDSTILVDPELLLWEVPDEFFSDNKPNKVDTYVEPLSEELLTRWAAQINNES